VFLRVEHCCDIIGVMMYCAVVTRSSFILEEHCNAICQNVLYNTLNLKDISCAPLLLDPEMQILCSVY
jgi:hypothetical protein